ncbi:peptidylprolyl isomerase, FKBP-type [Caballeronia telluris]|uniref:Peptidyl-prolyl cis-trans isomerase n=2 Tax=Caballeronia telluris TaxID=326475 RepID=A0A158HXZ3_9BURK|nr:peptidylprolyl isomerase, FKBP-type [Caballeronia telluris]
MNPRGTSVADLGLQWRFGAPRRMAFAANIARAPSLTVRLHPIHMSIIDISEVKPGSHVTLHYRLALADGADIVNTFTDKPATLLLGAGQLAPPLEDILLGLKVGHHSTFQLTPEQAFGPRNPELLQRVSLATLRENSMINEDFSPGDLVEFNAPGGGRYAGVLKEVGETSALFDFNHPLAGQALAFEVKIIGIL